MTDASHPRLAPGQDHQLKVLLMDASDRGGIATYTARLRQALEEEGAEVVLAAPAGAGDEDAVLFSRRWGPEIDQLGRLALYRLRLAEVRPTLLGVWRAVRRARPDVVHVQTDLVSGFDHLVLRLIGRQVPVVITAHDPVPSVGGEKEIVSQARRWRAADAVIIHGEEQRGLVEPRAGGTPVHTVPVDLPLGGPSVPRLEARHRLELADCPTALLLGQMRPYKGIGLLAEAWLKVVASLPEARLFLVGEPYEGAELDQIEREPGVTVRRGFIPEEELDWWAAAADVLVLPYRHGAHSGVLHRGLAAGTPVLASPSLSEEVLRTGAGRVVALDPALWSEALIDALGVHPLPRPQAPRGRESAAGNLAVYRQVLAARRGGRSQRPRLPRARRPSGAPVRVTYYIEGDNFGGVERHLLHVLDELDRARFTPTVVGVMAEETCEAIKARNVPLIRVDRVTSKFDAPDWLRMARAVHRARPEVFHAMLSQSYGAQYPLLAAVVRRTPAVVITAHLPTPSDSRLQMSLRRLLLRGVDVQVLPSEWTRSELRRMGQLHPVTEVVANGIVLPPLLSRTDARAALGLDASATVIGGSMRLVAEKRPELVIAAARAVPGAVVVILGSGPEGDRLHALAHGLDLRLPGFRPDAVALLPALDLFVHPAPDDNQPLAVLEAMGVGVPVLVADTGGAALMVDEGRTGLRAPATAEGMAAAARQMMADRGLRERLSAAGRQEVLDQFTAAAMTQRLEDLYDRLLESRPASATGKR